MPLHRRVPKRGFHNPFRVEYAVVNLDTLGRGVRRRLRSDAGGAARARARARATAPVKVLGRGDLTKKLTVRAHKFSGSAAKKIGGAGRHTEVINSRTQQSAGEQVTAQSSGMDSLKNIFAIPELRKRVLFTFGLLAVYRVGGHIPTPGINTQALKRTGQQTARARCSASTTCSPARTCRR